MCLSFRLARVILLAGLCIQCRGSSHSLLEPVVRLSARPVESSPVEPLGACSLRDDARPGFGCFPPIRIEVGTVTDAPEKARRFVHSFPLPPALIGRPLVLTNSLQVRGSTDPPRPQRPVVVPEPRNSVDVEVTIPAAGPSGTRIETVGAILLDREERWRTEPLVVPEGAVLVYGLGLQRLAPDDGFGRTEIRVLADAAGAPEREIDRITLDPAEAGADAWHERRIALGPLVNETVSLVFVERPSPRSGATAMARLGLPVAIGAPLVLRPLAGAPRRNVILVSIDTLRADLLGCYGSDLATSPHLDRIAGQGAIFERAFATYSSTTGSHMSMLTGVLPAVHGVTGPGSRVLGPSIRTLAERLTAAGLVTGAVTEDGMIVRGNGFGRGFDEYREFKGGDLLDVRGQVEDTVSAAIDFVDRHAAEPFLLFVHTYQVHAPYTPPPAFDVFRKSPAAHDDAGADGAATRHENDRRLYAGEVEYTDSVVARLIDRLDSLGLTDRTVLVVTGDHGEEFGEHGGDSHGRTLYDEVLHVPWIVRAPGLVAAGRRIRGVVSLIDLVPTVLDLLGLPAASDVQGLSQAPALRGEAGHDADERVVFAEVAPGGDAQRRILGVRTARHKWIAPADGNGRLETYDLDTDPHELRDLDDASLREHGAALITQYREMKDTAAGSAAPLDAPTIERLRALGYVM